jgi:hypothetical protein
MAERLPHHRARGEKLMEDWEKRLQKDLEDPEFARLYAEACAKDDRDIERSKSRFRWLWKLLWKITRR